MKKGVDKKRYDRLASVYDLMERPMELMSYARWRSKALEKAYDGKKILEIGVGTGKNLPYYNINHDVFGFDISKKMLKRAKRRAKSSTAQINLIQMDAEKLGFPDGTFDTSVSAYVFCSVENPEAGLREIKRVLKKGGTAIFLEHMRTENEFTGKMMDLINPLVVRMGPNINRRTVKNIEASGFDITEEIHLFLSIFRLIVASPIK